MQLLTLGYKHISGLTTKNGPERPFEISVLLVLTPAPEPRTGTKFAASVYGYEVAELEASNDCEDFFRKNPDIQFPALLEVDLVSVNNRGNLRQSVSKIIGKAVTK